MKKISTLVFVVIILVTVVVLAKSVLWRGGESAWGDANTYQSVFLVNGQVYFGKLARGGHDFMTLRDVYYLQVNQVLQPAKEGAAQTPDISLIKLGNELHGPMDEMQINRDQVLLIENLKADSKVVQAIEEYKKTAAAVPTTAPVAPAATR